MSHRSMYKHVCVCKCVPFPIRTNNNKNNRADTCDMQQSVVRMLRRRCWKWTCTQVVWEVLTCRMWARALEAQPWASRVTYSSYLCVLTFTLDFFFKWGEKCFHTAAHRSCFTFPVEFCSIFPLLLPRKRKRKSHTNQWLPHSLGLSWVLQWKCVLWQKTVKFWDV